MDYSNVDTLAEAVDNWCSEHEIAPLNGQASTKLSVRNLRYYRSLGLIDGPGEGGQYGRKHFCQLAAVRILQSKGQPLKTIQELLYGRTPAELERVLRDGAAEARQATSRFQPDGAETWRTQPLDDDWLLISRSGRRLTAAQLAALREILNQPSVPTRS